MAFSLRCFNLNLVCRIHYGVAMVNKLALQHQLFVVLAKDQHEFVPVNFVVFTTYLLLPHDGLLSAIFNL